MKTATEIELGPVDTGPPMKWFHIARPDNRDVAYCGQRRTSPHVATLPAGCRMCPDCVRIKGGSKVIAPDVLRQYRKLRQPHTGPLHRPIMGTAAACLRTARILAWFEDWETVPRSGGDWYTSLDGNWRVRFEIDGEAQDPGDMFDVALHRDTVPGGERTIKAQEKAYWRKLQEDGAWGYALDRKCGACGQWEHVDSCWGFDDLDYCKQEAASSAAYHIDKQGGWA